jgi:hypothetical protein
LHQSLYDFLADWHEEHEGNLHIILPDTDGTKGYLAGAPDWLASASIQATPQPALRRRSNGGQSAAKIQHKSW